MSAMRPWPQRYLVHLKLRSGAEVAVPVATWMDEAKAIAMAVSYHVRGIDDPQREPFEVTVEDLGPVPKAADGSTAIDGRDLVDRMEF